MSLIIETRQKDAIFFLCNHFLTILTPHFIDFIVVSSQHSKVPQMPEIVPLPDTDFKATEYEVSLYIVGSFMSGAFSLPVTFSYSHLKPFDTFGTETKLKVHYFCSWLR